MELAGICRNWDTMGLGWDMKGLGHDGLGWDMQGLGHDGTVLGHEGNGTRWDMGWDMQGLGHDGTGLIYQHTIETDPDKSIVFYVMVPMDFDIPNDS